MIGMLIPLEGDPYGVDRDWSKPAEVAAILDCSVVRAFPIAGGGLGRTRLWAHHDAQRNPRGMISHRPVLIVGTRSGELVDLDIKDGLVVAVHLLFQERFPALLAPHRKEIS